MCSLLNNFIKQKIAAVRVFLKESSLYIKLNFCFDISTYMFFQKLLSKLNINYRKV